MKLTPEELAWLNAATAEDAVPKAASSHSDSANAPTTEGDLIGERRAWLAHGVRSCAA